jgi:DNA polymerase V
MTVIALQKTTKVSIAPLSGEGRSSFVALSDAALLASRAGRFTAPLYESRVAAGAPSPADDHLEDSINIFEYLVEDAPQTFFVRADGDSMIDAGITPNSILSVDRRFEARHNHIVVAAVDGMLTVKRLYQREERTMLLSENERKNYPPLVVTDEMNLVIWGVVRGSVNLFKL